MPTKLTYTSPWKWVPSAYFMEGLPFTMIVVVSTIMYKNFGYTNKEITFYTGWLYIPWIIKPTWAWFVDLFKTKRWWIYAMEMLVACGFFSVALTINTNWFFKSSLIAFWFCAFFSASHDIATDGLYLISLPDGQQSFFVGMQSLFYRCANFFASGLLVLGSGLLLSYTKDLHLIWGGVMLCAGLITFCISIYHYHALPHSESPKTKTIAQGFFEIKQVFSAFFQLKQIWITILFVMTFRLGENMVTKIVPLFILDSRTNGGLGFNNTYLGFANIFILSSMIIAGITGGICISRFGLKRCLWPMLLFINLPHLIYIFLAYNAPFNQTLVLCLQVVEYFATTFSLTAYTMVNFHLVRNSQYKTAHYAFIAGIMVASIMFPSMFSGALQQFFGYTKFFVLVMFTMLPSLCIIPFIQIEQNFGKKY